MKLKYIGKESPIVLYKLEGEKKSVATGEVFECPGGYAGELLSRFNKTGRPPRFEDMTGKSTKAAPKKVPSI